MTSIPEQRLDYTRHHELVLAVLLYNSETWTLKEAQTRRLRVFEITILQPTREVTGAEMWMFGKSLVSLAT